MIFPMGSLYCLNAEKETNELNMPIKGSNNFIHVERTKLPSKFKVALPEKEARDITLGNY